MPKEKISGTDILLAAASYLWILFLAPFIWRRDSKFVMHHARQGLVLFLFECLVALVGWIPLLGWFVSMAAGLFLALMALFGIVHALMGEDWEMPVLGAYAKKIKI